MKWLGLPVAIVMMLAAPALAQSAPASQPSAADKSLSEAIMLSTRVDTLPSDVRGHVMRAQVLAKAALRLDPQNLLALQALAETTGILGNLEQAATNQGDLVVATGGRDYAAFEQWIRLKLETLSEAQPRVDFLKALGDNETFAPSCRALALSNLAAVEEGRGNVDVATGLYRKAISLDPTQPSALLALARLASSQTPAQKVGQSLAMLQGNPLAVSIVWDLGRLCRVLGLDQQALKVYEYAVAIDAAKEQTASKELRKDYLDALLDAGKAQRAVDECGSMADAPPFDTGVAGLLVEAYRMAGHPEKAKDLVDRMDKEYEPRERIQPVSVGTAVELAWFYVAYQNKPDVAEKWATLAFNMNGKDPTIQRIWAMCELAVGQAEQALPVLKNLAGQDAYAAAALADYYYTHSQAEEGEKVLAEAAKSVPRGGAPWRYLLRSAKQHGVATPPAEGEAQAADLLEKFDAGYFQMGRKPETFLSVQLRPSGEVVAAGEPVSVNASLKNIGNLPVPLGSWGLLTPRMVLKAELRVHQNVMATVEVPVNWSAPRHLKPGDSLEQTVRIDMGRAADLLASDPISDISISITGILDPVTISDKYVSSLRTVAVPSLQITRQGLHLKDQQGYYNLLVWLSQQLQSPDQVQAMRAANMTVSLLRMVEEVKSGRLHVADPIRANLREADLLALLKYCLQVAAPDIRARTLLAMQQLSVDNTMITLMAPCIGSPSAYVRLLAVELLGLKNPAEHAPILQQFAEKDNDDLVQAMAKMLTPKTP